VQVAASSVVVPPQDQLIRWIRWISGLFLGHFQGPLRRSKCIEAFWPLEDLNPQCPSSFLLLIASTDWTLLLELQSDIVDGASWMKTPSMSQHNQRRRVLVTYFDPILMSMFLFWMLAAAFPASPFYLCQSKAQCHGDGRAPGSEAPGHAVACRGSGGLGGVRRRDFTNGHKQIQKMDENGTFMKIIEHLAWIDIRIIVKSQ
jgi:hypothetical protein